MKGSQANKCQNWKPAKTSQCEKNFYIKSDKGQFFGQDEDFLRIRKLARESLKKFKYLLENEIE